MTNGLTDGRKKVGRELTKEGRTDGGRRKRHMDEGLEGEPIEGWRVLYERKEGRREGKMGEERIGEGKEIPKKKKERDGGTERSGAKTGGGRTREEGTKEGR